VIRRESAPLAVRNPIKELQAVGDVSRDNHAQSRERIEGQQTVCYQALGVHNTMLYYQHYRSDAFRGNTPRVPPLSQYPYPSAATSPAFVSRLSRTPI
jgi:hypothetical protein